MRVPACYRSFGLKNLSLESTVLAESNSSKEKESFTNFNSFEESTSGPRHQKEYRKYKAPSLSLKG